MKTGIITFHWATNYGAVLQAYALQQVLCKLGHYAYIIDYHPPRYKKNIIKAFMTKHIKLIPKRIREIEKEKFIEKFRQKNLKRTAYYSSNKKLLAENFEFDCYICGSDQIWNEGFLENGERRRTYSYLLNFAPDTAIIASYAASFGVTHYKEGLKQDLKKYLSRFDYISVREKTGLDILSDIGIYNACVVPDPTLLLSAGDYKRFISDNSRDEKYTYVYMLHGRDTDALPLINVAQRNNKIVYCGNYGIEKWLTDIYYAQEVITNSFHGVVFSILFKKNFHAVLIKGFGMNDRIVTLLNTLGLEDRIFNGSYNADNIEWDKVNERLEPYRKIGYDFLGKMSKVKE